MLNMSVAGSFTFQLPNRLSLIALASSGSISSKRTWAYYLCLTRASVVALFYTRNFVVGLGLADSKKNSLWFRKYKSLRRSVWKMAWTDVPYSFEQNMPKCWPHMLIGPKYWNSRTNWRTLRYPHNPWQTGPNKIVHSKNGLNRVLCTYRVPKFLSLDHYKCDQMARLFFNILPFTTMKISTKTT